MSKLKIEDMVWQMLLKINEMIDVINNTPPAPPISADTEDKK